MIQLSESYVSQAERSKEDLRELFEGVRSGRRALSQAVSQLDGNADDPQATRVKTVFRELREIARDTDKSPAFLDRLEALVAEFADA